jgi:glutaconate CoA-transferase subunit B
VSVTDDLFIAVMAREMGTCERVFLGANQIDAGIAAVLARRLWASDLRFWASGMAQIDPTRDAELVGLPTGHHVVVAERGATFMQGRAFEDTLRAPTVFAGGLQVDGRGNVNLVGLPRPGGWKLRGPGSAGLPSLTAFAERFYVIVPVHEPRYLVERCELISVLGDPAARRAAGLSPDALAAVLTPLARFETSAHGLVVTEINAGLNLEELAEHTGFELHPALEVAERPGLSQAEAAGIAELRVAADGNRADHVGYRQTFGRGKG